MIAKLFDLDCSDCEGSTLQELMTGLGQAARGGPLAREVQALAFTRARLVIGT